jgi:hypothetical protein
MTSAKKYESNETRKYGEANLWIYPMPNFFSALAIVWRKTFSALGVKVLACIKEMPYGFGGGVLHCKLGDEQVEEVGDGATAGSFGCAGKPGHFVRENEIEDDGEWETEALLEFRLSGVGTVEDVVLKSDRAGDVVIEEPGEADREGSVGEEFAGIWVSFRTTMRERCNRFLANRLET